VKVGDKARSCGHMVAGDENQMLYQGLEVSADWNHEELGCLLKLHSKASRRTVRVPGATTFLLLPLLMYKKCM
jgi:hypothetical protein